MSVDELQRCIEREELPADASPFAKSLILEALLKRRQTSANGEQGMSLSSGSSEVKSDALSAEWDRKLGRPARVGCRLLWRSEHSKVST